MRYQYTIPQLFLEALRRGFSHRLAFDLIVAQVMHDNYYGRTYAAEIVSKHISNSEARNA